MSSRPSLPLDILISIIDIYKDNDDMEMLRTWSLVSSAFLFLSRPHLYRSFDMRKHQNLNPNYQAQASSLSSSSGRVLFIRFHRLISSNPHLAPLVRTVHILEPGSPYHLHHRGNAAAAASSSFTCEHPAFASLMGLLPNIACFGLHFAEPAWWQSLSRRFAGAMGALCGRASLRVLYLEGIRRVPLGVLNGCVGSGLRELHVRDVLFASPNPAAAAAASFTTGKAQAGPMSRHDSEEGREVDIHSPDPRSPQDQVERRGPIYLDSASFASSQIDVFTLAPPVFMLDISRLQDLTIDFNVHTLNAVWDIISRAEQSLRRLGIGQSEHALGHSLFRVTSFFERNVIAPRWDVDADISSTRATLRHLTRLAHLSITISLPNTRKHEIWERIAGEWCALLRTARDGAGPSQVSAVTVVVDVSYLGEKELGMVFLWNSIGGGGGGGGVQGSRSGSGSGSESESEAKTDGKGKGKKKKKEKARDHAPNILAGLDETLANTGLFPLLSAVTMDVRVPEAHMVAGILAGRTGSSASAAVNTNPGSDLDAESNATSSRAVVVGGNHQDVSRSRLDTDDIDIDADADIDRQATVRPNLHSLRLRRKARPVTIEDIKMAVNRMMDRTRRRLREGPGAGAGAPSGSRAGCFVVLVGVGTH
ncbi:hypothetical protein CVT25_015168 [Psilocybe cyanescens]|uniref:Uncharacterized protein n=1 Tax=Psilocybe cyanescens TaxID=93625 RepID=A0A409X1Z7_PSICY|nr:hypothetical protein CVT25_015168 [Psilocybe cyanescens]